MKLIQFYIAVALSAICLILSVFVIGLGSSLQSLQTELQQQQDEINRGSVSQQVGTNVLRDIATAAVNNKNDKLRELLVRNGYSIQVNPAPSPGTSDSNSSTPTR